jgi:glutathione S-transferase
MTQIFTVMSLITVLAAVEVLVLGLLVGRGRATYGVPAPAMSGHPTWERLNRAHQNSLEQLVLFIPLFTAYVLNAGSQTGFAAGVVFLIARIVYAVGYVRDPARRAVGAWFTTITQVWLAVGAIVGLVVRMARS